MSDTHIRVYYEDTDSSGVVYHAAYLHYLERGRTEWLRELGFSHRNLLKEMGIAFTVSRLSLDYLRPARLDDALLVRTEVAEMRRASLVFSQRLWLADEAPDQTGRTRDDTGGRSRALLQARVRVACVAADGFRPCALPPELRQNPTRPLATHSPPTGTLHP